MVVTHIGHMDFGAQDGAVWGDYLFRFNDSGLCRVFDASVLTDHAENTALPHIADFMLGDTDRIIPHCNAVTFGCDFYAEGDEFPLLYANVYNNYANAQDRRIGMCCVYRLTRQGTVFSAALVQLLKIGFAAERGLWLSAGDVADVRPFGNFVVDRDRRQIHSFVMRDGDRITRYFTHRLPAVTEGVFSEEYGVPVAVLSKEEILSSFDAPYHLYVQGACCEGGLIWSSEGFGFNADIPPVLRVIDPEKQQQIAYCNLADLGYSGEAEWIDFYRGRCYYSDGGGALFEVALTDRETCEDT